MEVYLPLTEEQRVVQRVSYADSGLKGAHWQQDEGGESALVRLLSCQQVTILNRLNQSMEKL